MQLGEGFFRKCHVSGNIAKTIEKILRRLSVIIWHFNSRMMMSTVCSSMCAESSYFVGSWVGDLMIFLPQLVGRHKSSSVDM